MLVAAAAVVAITHTLCAQTNTLTRRSDPIVVKGARLPAMRGVLVSQIALYAAKNGPVAPVPFQIDEMDSSGAIALTTTDGRTTNPDDGMMDENDEIVFMACDLGTRLRREDLPRNCTQAVELACVDPVDGVTGWVYCVSFPGPVAYAAGRYVAYDLARDYVTTDRYELGYTPGQMKSYFSTLILKNSGDRVSPNVLSRYKFRVTLKLFFSVISINRNEDDMRSVLAGYKDGPVRAIRRCNNSIYLKFGIRSPTSVVDNYYYRDSIEWPTLIKLPFNVSTIASEALLITGCDWNPAAGGMRYSNSRNTHPVLVDGVMSDEEKNLDRGTYLWSAISGPQGALMSRLWLSESLIMGKELLYIDDKKIEDPPDDHQGHWGYNGWQFNVITVPAGTHRFVCYFYFPRDYKPGDETPYLNILDHPLQVRAQQLP